MTAAPTEAEREAEARIVAWLRRRAAFHRDNGNSQADPMKGDQLTVAAIVRHYADCIELGEHREAGDHG